MKKNKKLIVIIFMTLGILMILLFVIFNNLGNYNNSNKKILRFYNWEERKAKEYKYICKNNNCEVKEIDWIDDAISQEYYSLIDEKYYLYNPVTNEKININIDITNSNISKVFCKNNQIYALAIKDGDYSYEREYLYLMNEDKLYLKNISEGLINFMTYKGQNDEDIYINMNLIIIEQPDGHFSIIDFKNEKEVFNTKDFGLESEYDYISVNLTPIKVDDKYYYDLYQDYDKPSYILNDKFEKIVSYKDEGRGSQFNHGNQFSIHKNKIYIVNSNDSFSIYDMEGNLIEKSKTYDYIYCVDKGYFLINLENKNKYAVMDSNENIIFELDKAYEEGEYITVEDNIITVTTESLMCSSKYKYDIKANKLLEESYSCDDEI